MDFLQLHPLDWRRQIYCTYGKPSASHTAARIYKETGKTIQADAKFEGAEYSIYKDANCTNFVEKLTVDKNGYATSSD